MARQQTGTSSLRSSVEVVFRSYGLTFSTGIDALLKDDHARNPTDGSTGKTINAIARDCGLTDDDVLAFERALVDAHDMAPAEPIGI